MTGLNLQNKLLLFWVLLDCQYIQVFTLYFCIDDAYFTSETGNLLSSVEKFCWKCSFGFWFGSKYLFFLISVKTNWKSSCYLLKARWKSAIFFNKNVNFVPLVAPFIFFQNVDSGSLNLKKFSFSFFCCKTVNKMFLFFRFHCWL